jgi:glycosyltransferase involved in cell wall biosynthesis
MPTSALASSTNVRTKDEFVLDCEDTERFDIFDGAVTPEVRDRLALTPLPATLRLSVVMPVYNERKTLAEILQRVRAVPIPKEIIIVDDASTDGTGDLLKSMEGEPDLRIFYLAKNVGKGGALREGFQHVTGDIVIVQDADLEYNPGDYRILIQPILQDKADVVFGSRFLTTEARRVLSFWHSLGNRVLTLLSNVFTNLDLTDMETCYKVFRREVIAEIAPSLKQNRFGIEPELAAKVARRRCRVYEVGIRYDGRSYKDGKKIGWRDGLQAIWCILRYSRWD